LITVAGHRARIGAHVVSEKSKLLFQFLVVCGTLCILASLGGLLYLYLQTATLMGTLVPAGAVPKEISFMMFVVAPVAAVCATGLGMVVAGVWFGVKGDRGN
jgi:hypothetical protein